MVSQPQSQYVIDITRVYANLRKGKTITGVDRVSIEYIQHFATQACALIRLGKHWLVLPYAVSQQVFATIVQGKKPSTASHWIMLLRGLVGQVYNSQKTDILINTGHSGLEHFAYGQLIKKYNWKHCYFLHDLISITHPEYAAAGECQKHIRRVDNMLRYADLIIVNSAYTLHELQLYANRSHYTLPATLIAPLAPASYVNDVNNPIKAVANVDVKKTIPVPYFVVLGTIEPRKNHLLLLNTWRELVARQGQQTPHLIIVGRVGWMSENIIDLLHSCTTIQPYVRHLSDCSDSALTDILTNARALLFPSFVEGYGMPLAEALAMQVPVIASDLSVFNEIAQQIPDYVSPLDAMAWLNLIEDYAKPHSTARLAQLQRMQSFKTYTWHEHFSLVDDAIKHLR